MQASLAVVVILATFAVVQKSFANEKAESESALQALNNHMQLMCQPDWNQKLKFVPLQEPLIEGRPVRNFLPPRYENLFGHQSSKIRVASFAPSISDITGKVNQQRRQLFSWQPSNSDIFRR